MRFAIDLVFLDSRAASDRDRRAVSGRTGSSVARAAAAVLELPVAGGRADAARSPSRGRPWSSATTTRRPWSCSATTSPPTGSSRCRRRRAADALRLCHFKQPDLLLLDLNLPDVPGLEVLREIRASEGATGQLRPGAAGDRAQRSRQRRRPPPRAASAAPTTTWSSRSRSGGRRHGCGRCCAVARPARAGPLRVGEIVVDPSRREVRVAGEPVRLANKEFSLLRTLASEPSRVFTKAELLRDVWGFRSLGQDPDPRLAREPPASQARPRARPLRDQLLGRRLSADRRPGGRRCSPIAEAALVACPLALTCATVVVAERLRSRRRRELLNRALHELRRPLQALLLESRPRRTANGRDQLDQALEALDGIERQVNGGRRPVRPRLVDGRALAAEAVGRWRGPAAREGRWIELAWRAGPSRLRCDEGAISRALDNLIANALEHGSGPIRRRRHRARRTSLRLTVADGADAGRPSGAGRDDPRRAPSPGRRPARPRAADRRRGRRRARRAVRRLRPRARRQRGARATAGGAPSSR